MTHPLSQATASGRDIADGARRWICCYRDRSPSSSCEWSYHKSAGSESPALSSARPSLPWLSGLRSLLRQNSLLSEEKIQVWHNLLSYNFLRRRKPLLLELHKPRPVAVLALWMCGYHGFPIRLHCHCPGISLHIYIQKWEAGKLRPKPPAIH